MTNVYISDFQSFFETGGQVTSDGCATLTSSEPTFKTRVIF